MTVLRLGLDCRPQRTRLLRGRFVPHTCGKIGDDFFEREQNRLDTLRQLIVP